MASSFLGLTSGATPSTTAFSPVGPLQSTGASTFAPAAATSGNSLLNILSSPSLFAFGSLLSSGFQVFSTMKAAQLEQKVFNLKAQQQELQADQIKIASIQQANENRARLLDNLASADAAFAGRGVSLSSGTALQAQVESRKRAGEELQQTLAGGRVKVLGARGQAEQFRIEGAAKRSKGLLASSGVMKDAATSLSLIGGRF